MVFVWIKNHRSHKRVFLSFNHRQSQGIFKPDCSSLLMLKRLDGWWVHIPDTVMSKEANSTEKQKINQLCIAHCLEYFMGLCLNDSNGLNLNVTLCLNCIQTMWQQDCSIIINNAIHHNICSLIIMEAI